MSVAAITATGGAVLSRQPTIHLLRSPIVKWLQLEFSVTNTSSAATTNHNSSQILARNRLLRASPTLFISHLPNDTDHKHFTSSRVKPPSSKPTIKVSQQQRLQRKHLERISQQVYATCGHQLGWRCVPSCAVPQSNHHNANNIIGPKDRKELWDLAQRTGVSNVIAVGSSAAMYLAKSTTTTDPDIVDDDHINNNNYSNYKNQYGEAPKAGSSIHQQRILTPLTYEAVWASTTSHVLLLSHPFSPDEPMLSAIPASIPTCTMVVLDPPSMWGTVEDRNVAYQAAVALALDSLYWHLLLPPTTPTNSHDDESWKAVLQHWIQQHLHHPNDSQSGDDSDNMTATTLQALASMGERTRFGLLETAPARSIPLAIAVSLLPRILISQEESTLTTSDAASISKQLYEDAGMMFLRIMASLVPGMLQLVVSIADNKENNASGINFDDDDDNDVTKLLKDLASIVKDSDRDSQSTNEREVTTKVVPQGSLYSLASPLLLLSQSSSDDAGREKLLDIILDLVQENREHWNCQDVDDSILEQVVYDSLDFSVDEV